MVLGGKLARLWLLLLPIDSTTAWFVRSPIRTLTPLRAASVMTHNATEETSTTVLLGWPSSALHYDTYNGVSIYADQLIDLDPDAFGRSLASALDLWRAQGRRGIWLHIPPSHSALIAAATELDFDFHMVIDRTLILTKWLPYTPSRLPVGPTHQVGIGCLVLHPNDPSLMLVVREKTGPAAGIGLWKMPTGLTDTGEDVHAAAVRELREETSLEATFGGILAIRQAHATGRGVTIGRTHSDLFFVCRMELQSPPDAFVAEEDEIAAIQWMAVNDYCAQERWQTSPVYRELNNVIRSAVEQVEFAATTLPLGFKTEATNTLFMSKPLHKK